MARKHNTKHARVRSKYPLRLWARGVSGASVRMPDLDTLQHRANNHPDKGLRARLARIQLRRGLYYGPRPYSITGSDDTEEVAA